MKYVIKQDKSNVAYYWSKGDASAFTLDMARKFDSVGDAVTTLVEYAQMHPNNLFPRFTIIGVKEVVTPTYEEVEL